MSLVFWAEAIVPIDWSQHFSADSATSFMALLSNLHTQHLTFSYREADEKGMVRLVIRGRVNSFGALEIARTLAIEGLLQVLYYEHSSEDIEQENQFHGIHAY